MVGSHGCVIPWPGISEVWNSHTNGVQTLPLQTLSQLQLSNQNLAEIARPWSHQSDMPKGCAWGTNIIWGMRLLFGTHTLCISVNWNSHLCEFFDRLTYVVSYWSSGPANLSGRFKPPIQAADFAQEMDPMSMVSSSYHWHLVREISWSLNQHDSTSLVIQSTVSTVHQTEKELATSRGRHGRMRVEDQKKIFQIKKK